MVVKLWSGGSSFDEFGHEIGFHMRLLETGWGSSRKVEGRKTLWLEWAGRDVLSRDLEGGSFCLSQLRTEP
jgi:hypothetical protein